MPNHSIRETLHKFKHGQLHSGSKKGRLVSSRKQAIAIALSEDNYDGPKGKSVKKSHRLKLVSIEKAFSDSARQSAAEARSARKDYASASSRAAYSSSKANKSHSADDHWMAAHDNRRAASQARYTANVHHSVGDREGFAEFHSAERSHSRQAAHHEAAYRTYRA